jgi:hypothetical protein
MTALLLALALALGQVGTVAIGGDANYANPSHGSHYLAMRLPRGTVVTICGAGGCWRDAVVNDYGPVVATGDIADIALVQFAKVCGWSIAEAKRRGECSVTVEYGGTIRLPETDTAPWSLFDVLALVR